MDQTLIVGRVYTLDRPHGTASAVLVRGGAIACVGSRDECAREAGPKVKVVDVGSGAVLPGLADAHGHVLGLGRAAVEVRCSGARSEEECAARAAERARALPPGTWIRGRGWDQNLWPGARFPTERALSARVPDHPVVLWRVDGHAVWVNRRALEAAGIGPGTPDPDGGRIIRQDADRPTGVLVDNAADLVNDRIPPPTRDEIERLLGAAMAELVRVGLTSVHDAGVDPQTLEVYRSLAAADRLPLRVYAMIDGQAPRSLLAEQLALWTGTPEVGRLTVRAVKLFADGALGSRGAALFEPYSDDPSTSGLLVTAPAELRARVLQAARGGFQPAVHAIGDRAVAEVAAAFAAAAQVVDLRALRPRVEHLQMVRPSDLLILRDVGAVASMQPTHATSDAPWAEQRLGPASDRLRGAYAWRLALDSRLPLAFGSDFPVESHDPRLGLFAAEARRPAGWTWAWMPEQRLGREEAVRAFTAGAAFAAHAEARRGIIRVGLDADLTIFDRDVMVGGPDDLLRAEVTHTMVGGRFEYQR
ncbi:MAG TPA: amidohydrolase [Anaeromyxobacteraceae bacterium]|nr:amidohydrolase [Anaeromyxobacteraceae bacterium]